MGGSCGHRGGVIVTMVVGRTIINNQIARSQYLVVERVTTRANGVLNALKTMDITRRNTGKNGININ